MKKLQGQLKDTNTQLEEEQRQREEQHMMATKAEKRANDMQLELEELRAKVEQVYPSLTSSLHLLVQQIVQFPLLFRSRGR